MSGQPEQSGFAVCFHSRQTKYPLSSCNVFRGQLQPYLWPCSILLSFSKKICNGLLSIQEHTLKIPEYNFQLHIIPAPGKIALPVKPLSPSLPAVFFLHTLHENNSSQLHSLLLMAF